MILESYKTWMKLKDLRVFLKLTGIKESTMSFK